MSDGKRTERSEHIGTLLNVAILFAVVGIAAVGHGMFATFIAGLASVLMGQRAVRMMREDQEMGDEEERTTAT